MSKWLKSEQNLWRNTDSKRYYARAEYGGRDVWRTLKTDKITTARLRLPGALAKIRTERGGLVNGNLSFAEAAEIYKAQKFNRKRELKPLSVEYRQLSVKMLLNALGKPAARKLDEFKSQDCLMLMEKIRKAYSPRRANGALWALRGIFEIGIDSEVITKNPAKKIEALAVQQNARDIPPDEKFYLLYEKLERHPRLKNTLAFARILALTGHRPESVRRLMPEHVDLAKRVVKWPPIKHKSDFNIIPMSDELYEIMVDLKKRHKGSGPLMPLKDPRAALETASKLAEISPPITPGVFRHFWSTRMMEQTDVPIPTLARMRGDRDGGQTMMRTYGHLRQAHLREMVARIPGTRPAMPDCLPRRSGRSREVLAR
jgi:integrase